MPYTNASRRTVLVARGIYLWAKLSDCPAGKAPQDVLDEWNAYEQSYPEEARMAQWMQTILFDRCNGHDWQT